MLTPVAWLESLDSLLRCWRPRVLAGRVRRAADAPPVHVVLWFDAEDYILPEDDDATKRLAEMLTRLNVKATFKVVGEKARVLEQRGRTDVIAALKGHEIGYHSNTHSQQPTIAVYLQHAGWDDGRAEFERREGQGSRDVARIFGKTLVAYGQPGSAWAPQSYPALRAMGIGMYLDEADHVGIDDQPFYYGGMLNVFKMRSTLARMALGGTILAEGTAHFTKIVEALRARGGGTISIYYHPSEWVHAEFWDAVNFSRGANPPRAAWKKPRTRPAAETETAFADFEQYIRFIQQQPGVKFVTATDLMRLYADRAVDALVRAGRPADDRRRGAAGNHVPAPRRRDALGGRRLQPAHGRDGRSSSGPDACPRRRASCRWLGPTRPFVRDLAGRRAAFPMGGLLASHHRRRRLLPRQPRMPDAIWVGTDSLSPADFLGDAGSRRRAVVARGRRRPKWRVGTDDSPRIDTSRKTRPSCGAGRSFPKAFTRPRSWRWRGSRRGR